MMIAVGPVFLYSILSILLVSCPPSSNTHPSLPLFGYSCLLMATMATAHQPAGPVLVQQVSLQHAGEKERTFDTARHLETLQEVITFQVLPVQRDDAVPHRHQGVLGIGIPAIDEAIWDDLADENPTQPGEERQVKIRQTQSERTTIVGVRRCINGLPRGLAQ